MFHQISSNSINYLQREEPYVWGLCNAIWTLLSLFLVYIFSNMYIHLTILMRFLIPFNIRNFIVLKDNIFIKVMLLSDKPNKTDLQKSL